MQALFDLAGRQEYIEPLRAELEDVMASEGGRDLDPKALRHLAKMDSFLKESQRHVAQNIRVSPSEVSRLYSKDGAKNLFCSLSLPKGHISFEVEGWRCPPHGVLRLRSLDRPGS